MLSMKNIEQMILLAGNGNPALAYAIGNLLDKEVTNPITYFADGEVRVKGLPNLRKRSVFIIQPTAAPVNDNIMELVLLIDAARRASASEITAVIPYFGYSRQDRKEMPRVPISASAVANMILNAGADRIMTIDVHAEQSQGFVMKPWDNLYGSYTLIPVIKKFISQENTVIVSPDKGGVPRATGYAALLGIEEIAIVYKQRDLELSNTSKVSRLIGNVQGKNLLILDDMLDSGGTVFNSIDYLVERGAKDIYVAVTHGLFTRDSLQRLAESKIKKIIVTDTINHREAVRNNDKIDIISVAPLLAEAIAREQSGESISEGLILKP